MPRLPQKKLSGRQSRIDGKRRPPRILCSKAPKWCLPAPNRGREQTCRSEKPQFEMGETLMLRAKSSCRRPSAWRQSCPRVRQLAGDAEAASVRFSDVGWTDITATTGVASVLLRRWATSRKSRCCRCRSPTQSLKNKDIDVFLGNWMPKHGGRRQALHRRRLGRDDLRESRRRQLQPRGADTMSPTRASRTSRTSPSSRTSSTARSTASSPAMTATA